jgi:hypothetical protein
MYAMKAKVDAAFALFEANKDYLRQPATKINRNLPQTPAALLDGLRRHG